MRAGPSVCVCRCPRERETTRVLHLPKGACALLLGTVRHRARQRRSTAQRWPGGPQGRWRRRTCRWVRTSTRATAASRRRESRWMQLGCVFLSAAVGYRQMESWSTQLAGSRWTPPATARDRLEWCQRISCFRFGFDSCPQRLESRLAVVVPEKKL
jgi:hypothetical protein